MKKNKKKVKRSVISKRDYAKPVRHYKDPLRQFHPATSVILSGYRSGLSQYSVKPPLFRTSTFEFPTAEDGEKFFQRAYHLEGDDQKEPGLIYSRLNNPNLEIAEDKLVAAEVGSKFALLFPSGMSAITTSLMALLKPGARVLYSDPVYGGTYLFFKEFCPNRFGIQTIPVDTSDLQAFEKKLKKDGPFDLIYLESPTNPTLRLCHIEKISKLAKKQNPECLVMVDNTFLGPVFQSPFLFGADIVIYSATKFIGGHSDLLAGVVLTKEKKFRSVIQDYRTILGATVAPDIAWMLTRSIETLWVRMIRQSEKAEKIAHALKRNKHIQDVYFPGFESQQAEQKQIYKKQCQGPGSMITFTLKKNNRKAAFRFLNSLEICHLAVSLGGTETLIEHPRSMTHSDMMFDDLDRAGISEGMIRLSVGLESTQDIIADLEQALGKLG